MMGIMSWTGLWFGLAIPLIVLMYLLKRRYTEMLVPSHLLWERVLQTIEANRPWQKLRNTLLLWLQLLVALLLVFALMLPFVQVEGKVTGHQIIIADTSASMSSLWRTDSDGVRDIRDSFTRLDRMKEQLADYIKSFDSGSELSLIVIGNEPEVLLSREKDRDVWKKAIGDLNISYGKSAYRETLSLAAAMTRGDPDTNVVLFTDSGWKEAAGDMSFENPLQVVNVGGGMSSNAAIQQFGIRSDSEGSGTAIVTVLSEMEHRTEITLNLYGDDNLLSTTTISLQPGMKETVTFGQVEPYDLYRVALDVRDDYAADNEAFAFREHEEPLNILYLSQGNLFMEKALQVTGAHVTKLVTKQPDVTRTDGTTEDSPPVPEQRPDVIIIEGAAPDYVSEKDWAQLLSETPVWTIGGDGKKVAPDRWEMKTVLHPVTRYLSVTDPPAGAFIDQSIPAWGKVIMDVGGTSAAYAGLENGLPRLVFLFELEDGDWTLRPEFPILVNNAVSWLNAGRSAGLGRITAGEPIEVPVAAEAVSAQWVPVEGYVSEVEAESIALDEREGRIITEQTGPSIPGLWRLDMFGAEKQVLSSYYLDVSADHAESLQGGEAWPIVSGQNPGQNQGVSPAVNGPSPMNYSLVPWIALLALIVILVEWGVYQRGRSV